MATNQAYLSQVFTTREQFLLYTTLPAINNLWGSPLESQGIWEGHFSAQNPLFRRLVLVYEEAVDDILPVTNGLAIIRL